MPKPHRRVVEILVVIAIILIILIIWAAALPKLIRDDDLRISAGIVGREGHRHHQFSRNTILLAIREVRDLARATRANRNCVHRQKSRNGRNGRIQICPAAESDRLYLIWSNPRSSALPASTPFIPIRASRSTSTTARNRRPLTIACSAKLTNSSNKPRLPPRLLRPPLHHRPCGHEGHRHHPHGRNGVLIRSVGDSHSLWRFRHAPGDSKPHGLTRVGVRRRSHNTCGPTFFHPAYVSR